jgi:uncharacterized membrane protein
MKRALILSLILGMFVSLAIVQAAASEDYATVQSNYRVHSGQIEAVDGCYMTFNVTNGSNYVHVSYNGPGYPNKEVNIPEGQTDYYQNKLRIYVARVENDTAIVDIAKFVSSSDGTPSSGTKVYCDIPGQTALGGDVVSFPIVIQNNDQSDHTYELSASSDISWKTWFEYGGKGVYKIYVPGKQSKTVDLMVQTWGNTPVGEKKVIAYVDDIRFEVSVDITSANQSADVSYKVTSKIAYIGDKITYDLHIRNVQARENLYTLAVTGLPDNWYYRFKESATSAEEMAEVIIPASSEKDLVLEIVPPYTVGTGSYNFTSVVTTPDGVAIKKDLTLNLKSGTGMGVTSSRLAYDAKPGEAFNIVVYVSNTGQGSALTNVYLETTAPEGWLIQTSPNRTNSIKAGESQAFTLAVQPPGNIVASDYEVNVKAKSDQAEMEKDYRITIKTDSIIPYLGAGIIVLVVAGLFLIYRKYGRR